KLDAPVRRSLQQGKGRGLARGGVEKHRVESVDVIPKTVYFSVELIFAVGEGCGARWVERNREHATVAPSKVGQAFELHRLNQPCALHRIFGGRADFLELGGGRRCRARNRRG